MLAALVTLAAVAGLLYGLARLGDEARRRIGPRDRYTVRFADVECDTPPGRDRYVQVGRFGSCRIRVESSS